uniref:DUF148 domain-containing protein n=1 Tax=Steinernema glaseri TaxID=37863 RepID=A0A1I7ZZK9_9BILA
MLYCCLFLFTVIACVEAKPAHHDENPIYSVFYHRYSKPLVLNVAFQSRRRSPQKGSLSQGKDFQSHELGLTVQGQKDVKKAFPGELQKAATEMSKMDEEEKKALLEYYPNLKIVTGSNFQGPQQGQPRGQKAH